MRTGILRALLRIMQTTLAEMLSILVDAVTESDHRDPTGLYPDSVIEIATAIEAEHSAIPFCETLRGLDPFQGGYIALSGGNIPLRTMINACFYHDTRSAIADVDGALFRLSNTGYSHSI